MEETFAQLFASRFLPPVSRRDHGEKEIIKWKNNTKVINDINIDYW